MLEKIYGSMAKSLGLRCIDLRFFERLSSLGEDRNSSFKSYLMDG